MKNIWWKLVNIFGYLFGWRFFAPFFKILANLSAHGLGYDNVKFTGEYWFIHRILAKPGVHVCLDVGANIGRYSRNLQNIGAKVYAIEPLESSFKKLSTIDGITAIQAAATNYDGEAILHFSEEFCEGASLSPSLGGRHTQKVRALKLDTLCKEFQIEPDFVKIDVEGFEFEVIQGMSFRPRYIQLEFNHHHLKRGQTLKTLTDSLPEYTFYRLLPHGWIKINPEKWTDNLFMFCNIVAVNRNLYTSAHHT
jgi:FkbM family methyltransferase